MILIDTGPLVALCDPRDSLNKTALKHLQTLAKSQLVTCEPVIAEACFHLSTATQRTRLQQMLKRLPVAAAQIDDPSSLWKEVFDWLDRYSDHSPDWTDGYLAVLSRRHPKIKIWTYDVEFRTTWRRSDGSRIPLAISF